MSSSSEMLEKNCENSELHTREDSEYARLVAPNELRTADINSQQALEKSNSKSFIWWMKLLSCCLLLMLLAFIFVKWGVPFAFEKVVPVLANALLLLYL